MSIVKFSTTMILVMLLAWIVSACQPMLPIADVASVEDADPQFMGESGEEGEPAMKLLHPGDTIDDMTLAEGPVPFGLSVPPYVAFCNANPQLNSDLTLAKPGVYTVDCSIPPLPELLIGLGWITSDEQKRDEFWNVMDTVLYVNDQPVDQQAFGRLDADIPMTGLPGADPDEMVIVPLRVWNVVLQDITGEKLTLRYVWDISQEAFDGFSTYPAGIYDLTYTITVDDSLAEAEGQPAPVEYVLQQPEEIFNAFNAAVNTHDVDAQLTFFADEAIANFPDQPPPNLHRGRDEIRTWLQADADDNIRVEVEGTATSGETVSAIANITVDSLPPDLILVGVVEITVADGKITSFTYTLDDETLAQLAALESE